MYTDTVHLPYTCCTVRLPTPYTPPYTSVYRPLSPRTPSIRGTLRGSTGTLARRTLLPAVQFCRLCTDLPYTKPQRHHRHRLVHPATATLRTPIVPVQYRQLPHRTPVPGALSCTAWYRLTVRTPFVRQRTAGQSVHCCASQGAEQWWTDVHATYGQTFPTVVLPVVQTLRTDND